jgi:hypothetical protein
MPIFANFLRALSLSAALLMALAWPAHVALADRSAADLDCQVSALASSSELNADCGGQLLELPLSFTFLHPQAPFQAYVHITSGAFRGRAPPFL